LIDEDEKMMEYLITKAERKILYENIVLITLSFVLGICLTALYLGVGGF